METMTARGKVEGWYVELREEKNRQRCITCNALTYGRNESGVAQDFTCYFNGLVEEA